jgi:hypothetical protein
MAPQGAGEIYTFELESHRSLVTLTRTVSEAGWGRNRTIMASKGDKGRSKIWSGCVQTSWRDKRRLGWGWGIRGGIAPNKVRKLLKRIYWFKS